jgi:hypothetical protein
MDQTLTAKIQIYPTDSEALLFKQIMDAIDMPLITCLHMCFKHII